VSSRLDTDRLAVLVHELRSPVAALSAVAAAVVDAEGDPAARRELARLAAAACRAIERIVADVAVTSIRREAIEPVALVRDVVATARLRGVRIALAAPELAPTIEADPTRVRQVLDNLITNAVVHGGAGVDISISVRLDDAVRIDVTDSGEGIPPDELARIFETGVRLDSEAPGTGLGLALARAVAEGHGGTLTVASSPGEGTTFTLSLPVSDS
jgi:signal transduction histidine kinase